MSVQSIDQDRRRLLRQSAPFTTAILAGFAVAALPPYPTYALGLLVAGLWAVVVVAAIALLPWHRLPETAAMVPPLALLPAIAMLNYAKGDLEWGYAPLAVLPVVWIALLCSRPALLLAIVGVAAIFLAPVFALGDEFYATSEWRISVMWAATAAVLGLAVEGLMRRMRKRAAAAAQRVEVLEQRAREGRILLENARLLAATLDKETARQRVCEAARAVAKSAFSILLEPDGEGHLTSTAQAGITAPPLVIQMGAEPSGAVVALTSKQPFFVRKTKGHPAVSQRMVKATGAGTLHFEPVLRGQEAIGVLVVAWRHSVPESPSRADALGLIAAEAAMALERADLLSRLQEAAKTDELTGLPNRRSWDEEISRELARARRSGMPFCLAVLDLDRFKQLNDDRGHQAGDRLLKDSASAWRSAIRATDMLARYGGEEFAVALPSCTIADAERLVERLRAATPGGMTISAGIAQWDGMETADALFSRADSALYEAKAAGRDRIATAA